MLNHNLLDVIIRTIFDKVQIRVNICKREKIMFINAFNNILHADSQHHPQVLFVFNTVCLIATRLPFSDPA